MRFHLLPEVNVIVERWEYLGNRIRRRVGEARWVRRKQEQGADQVRAGNYLEEKDYALIFYLLFKDSFPTFRRNSFEQGTSSSMAIRNEEIRLGYVYAMRIIC